MVSGVAPLPIIPDTWRAAFIWSCPAFTRKATNVMHFLYASPDAATLFSKISANVTATMWAATRSDTLIESVTLTPLDGAGASTEHATSGAKWAGQATGGSDVVPQACPLVSLRTGVRGRSYRGRVYLPWPSEGSIASGSLGSSQQTTMQSAWTAFVTAMDATSAPLVVASYKNASQALVTTATVEQLLATQRRRQPRP